MKISEQSKPHTPPKVSGATPWGSQTPGWNHCSSWHYEEPRLPLLCWWYPIVSIKPDNKTQLFILEACLKDIKTYMTRSFRLLNSDKSEAVLGPKHLQKAFSSNVPALDAIKSSTTVRNPGVLVKRLEITSVMKWRYIHKDWLIGQNQKLTISNS